MIFNLKVLEIFVHCFDKYGKQREKTYYQGLRRKFYQAPLELMLDEDHYAEYLDLLSLAMGVAIYAPFAADHHRDMYGEDPLEIAACPAAGCDDGHLHTVYPLYLFLPVY